VASNRPMTERPGLFVDSSKGSDRQNGSLKLPWKTLKHAFKQLKPGDTLYLRGGVYYESNVLAAIATPEKPITIRSYPGELAILDGGLREFAEDAANAWEPVPNGSEGEYRSKKTYPHGGGFGNFADSMVPLHRYITINDLRSKNEFFTSDLGKRQDSPTGIYCGPGVFRDPETGRIHVRLAHTQLEGLGKNHYRGETDPRRMPLIISGSDYTLRIEGARHIRLQDLVIRGAERSAVLMLEDSEDVVHDSEDIEFEGVTLYGSGSAIRTTRTRGLRMYHCNLRGHAAPWHSRAHHKYRAYAGYLAMIAGRDFEFAGCEFTDHHDCLQVYFADEVKFHHNLVDNFNDDGIECGPKKEKGHVYVFQNIITRCLNPFTLHGDQPIFVNGEEGSGVYIYRNVVDMREGTYKTPPSVADPTGAYLNSPTVSFAHDHGGPVHPNYYVYHNTFLMNSGVFRGYYAFTWAGHMRGTTRRVFNNIFVQVEGLPGLNLVGTTSDDDLQVDGNLYWGMKEGPSYKGEFFGKYQKTPLFEASKKRYTPGWGAHDLFADPKFVSFEPKWDPHLRQESPAIDAGVSVPEKWPDPLRSQDKGKPDVGAFPLTAEGVLVGPVGWKK